ncbi:MAG: hypothetical protein GKR90_23250 [Pseudomonadales bacterium]|nr:hypothetical protein [Pseudomonadales bacterium]
MQIYKSTIVLLLGFGLVSCGGGGSGSGRATPVVAPPVQMSEFQITVTNLTNAQPLSPVALIAHDGTQRIFSLGEAATIGLEELAEGGDNTTLLAEGDANGAFQTSSSGGPVGPSESTQMTVAVTEAARASLHFSIATMLVNTNDAFTAANATDVSGLGIGGSMTLRLIAYDAGTEADSEAAGSIPGPAVGGEGFNVDRDDEADRVSMHPGVLSAMDGLATSVLSDQHRFDNPVVQVSITRVN